MTQGFAFLPEALESNAAGRLTDAQREMFGRVRWLKRWLSVFTGDVRRGDVKVIDGAIHKPSPTGNKTPGLWTYYLEVAGRRFEVPSKSVWEAAPGAGHVRLYYLPHSHTAINLERLPDPPVDPSKPIAETMGDILGSIRPGFTTKGRIERAERMAQADAELRAALGGDMPPSPTDAAPASPADVAGHWTSPAFEVIVRADGTLTMTSAMQSGGQDGHWRIGPEGRLHLRFADDPDELVTDYSLQGDALAIDLGGQRIVLRRAPG